MWSLGIPYHPCSSSHTTTTTTTPPPSLYTLVVSMEILLLCCCCCYGIVYRWGSTVLRRFSIYNPESPLLYTFYTLPQYILMRRVHV